MQIKATLKNVNLRPELTEGGDKVGAFDLSLEVNYDKEMHELLTKQDKISCEQLEKLGVDSYKLVTEYDDLLLHYGDYSSDRAKLNNASVTFGTNNKAKVRIQAYLAEARGMAEEINVHTGELMYLTVDIESGDLRLVNQQGDILEDDTQTASPAEPVKDEPVKKAAAAKKKVAKKKASKKAAAKKSTDTQEGTTTPDSAVKHEGQNDDNLTDEQIKAREAEKNAILGQQKPSDAMDTEKLNAGIDDMIGELSGKQLGQGDELEFKLISDKHMAGRRLSDMQSEKLLDLHGQYCR